MESIANTLSSLAAKKGRDVQIVFGEFLDYIIDCFSIDRLITGDGNYELIFAKIKEEDSDYFPAFAELVMKSSKLISKNNVYDLFGNIYELMFQSGRKAASLGQFFTPQTVADICSRIMYKQVDGRYRVNEPTCGSGRNLLSVFSENKDKPQYYVAEDLDSVSVKMCAINMMMHGMTGCCICHNTLFPSEFIFGYEVNEVRYPFPCECYSLRPISIQEYERRFERRSI